MKGIKIALVLPWLLNIAIGVPDTLESTTLEIDQDIVLSEDPDAPSNTYDDECKLDTPYQFESGSFTDGQVLAEDDTNEAQVRKAVPPIEVRKEISYPYEEELLIRPLPGNYLLTSFSFGMDSEQFVPGKSALDYDDYGHYTVFPMAFRPIMDHTGTRQMHLRFTRGFWNAESWGRLPHNGFKSGGSGVELWAVIEAETKDQAYNQWKTLANSLSGLFCASINFIDNSRTTYPVKSFQPNEQLPLFNENRTLFLIRAALANEPVCTENLTPFVKLFPTKGRSGISSLLDGHKVFDSSWHSLSIDITTNCENNDETCKYQMEAFVDAVMNVPNVLNRSERPIPKPLPGDKLRCDLSKPFDSFQCFPLPEETEVSYSLSKIYGKQILGSSLISNHPSRVCVEATKDWMAYVKVGDTYFSTDDNCFELKDSLDHDIYLESDNSSSVVTYGDAPLYVSRSLTGYGQDRGGLRTVFKNPHSEPVKAVYFESLPWFMRVFLSTLTLEPGTDCENNLTLEAVVGSTYYLPAVDRARPTHLEYLITVPANTSFAISYQFDKSLLQYAEYPPDANHGFEIESAVITVLEPSGYQMRTATLLLLLSTPDFSMPYNVIILTSTVIGLIFGTLFNLIVKRMVSVQVADQVQASSGLKYKIKTLKQKLLGKVKSLRE